MIIRIMLVAFAVAVLFAVKPAIAETTTKGTAGADRAATTASGATFRAPQAWTLSTAPTFTELSAPEGDTRIALVEVDAAANAEAAVEAAWASWKPAFSRHPKLVTALAAHEGWDEQKVVDYEVAPNEKRAIQAIALRAGSKWNVMILDGSEATVEKRLAAIRLVSQSLRPAGYVRETFAGRSANRLEETRIAALKAFVLESMRQLGIPGAAFALTDRTGTFYSTGIGVRELGSAAPIDADSEFMVASNTKGMTTLLLAKLADEGKLSWEQPVTQLYPPFRLGGAATTAKVEVKHLVCACTGLPRKDMEWLFNTRPTTPASDTFVQLGATEPTSNFGELFQYNNLMASAAGYLAGHIAYPMMELGRAYDRAMREKIFAPLGMNSTTFDYSHAMANDWARPHGDDIDGNSVALGDAGMKLNRAVIPFRPAGAAWSTANDLAKYVRFELNEGKLDDGRQWVSAKNLLERRLPNVSMGEDRSYGMGLMTDNSYGVPVIHHGGSLFGYKSDILLIPSAGVGAVILTNSQDGQMLLRPFMRRLLEILYDGKLEAAEDVAAAAARSKAEKAKERQLITLPPDPAIVATLASAYASPELGRMTIEKRQREVVFNFTTFSSRMATKKNEDGSNSFICTDPVMAYFPIVVGSDGGKRTLIVRDGQHEYKFVEAK